MYWSDKQIKSYNCLFNFIVGSMGTGKSYCKKVTLIDQALEDKGHFIWMRRKDRELKKCCQQFFDDIKDKYPNMIFRVCADRFESSEADEDGNPIQWKLLGYAVYLSGARTQKSTSYSTVTDIVYDEFIIPTKKAGMYEPDEVTTFLEFYESVARMRNVRVWFLANALTKYNPYFLYWDIVPPHAGIKRISSEIAVEMVANKDYIEAKKQTRFGSIVKGTDFERYAYDNQFTEDDECEPLVKKTRAARYAFSLCIEGDWYGIYRDMELDKMIVSHDYDATYPLKYAISSKNGKVNRMITSQWRNIMWLKATFTYFMDGAVGYETHRCRMAFINMMRKIM